ncbi:radical SAM protein [Aeromonas caviae]|uniref:Radical SAM protein n=1 Tax=Aeromonas caviae TaxID=648 RepID=A0AAW9EVN8_AERCA|nr:radical SAM protein [Aeromonas caviae]MDX7719401.1 radical SAM protein [Aeromonas caviae]
MRSQYFRLSITNQCTLNCYFCHNEGQDKKRDEGALLSCDDIVWVCKQMKAHGFSKFKLTGGEPLLRKDLPNIVARVLALGIDDLSIITNGTLLGRRVAELAAAGLPRLNVSLYSLSPALFYEHNGGSTSKLESVKRGIDLAIEHGYTDMKINYVFHGKERIDDFKAALKYVGERNLTLVVLPLIPLNAKASDEEITLQQLYSIIAEIGIVDEVPIIDAEGIRRRLITTSTGGKILLRIDELKDRLPFSRCNECDNKSECREGIFPLRMSADGMFRPCLAGGMGVVDARDAIRDRNEVLFGHLVTSIMGG